jgi:hypothetical protein
MMATWRMYNGEAVLNLWTVAWDKADRRIDQIFTAAASRDPYPPPPGIQPIFPYSCLIHSNTLGSEYSMYTSQCCSLECVRTCKWKEASTELAVQSLQEEAAVPCTGAFISNTKNYQVIFPKVVGLSKEFYRQPCSCIAAEHRSRS